MSVIIAIVCISIYSDKPCRICKFSICPENIDLTADRMWTCICRSILIKIILILVNGLPCFLHSRTIRFKIIILAIDLFQSGCRISGILHIIKLSIICYELISVEHTILIEITGMSIDSCKSGCCLSVTAK